MTLDPEKDARMMSPNDNKGQYRITPLMVYYETYLYRGQSNRRSWITEYKIKIKDVLNYAQME